VGKFSKNVFETFDGLGFTPSKGTATEAFAALLRREGHDVCSYIYVRDDRSGNGAIAIHYWIAPPDFPDDGLDNLGVGFRILIASSFRPSDEFLTSARTRLERLLLATPVLAEVVSNDSKAPAIVTKRLAAYREEVTFFRVLTEVSMLHGNADMAEAIERAADVVRRERPYRDFVAECQGLVQITKAKPEAFPVELRRLIAQSELMLQTMISRQMYVEFLVPFVQ
jgi:hypothetical protein